MNRSKQKITSLDRNKNTTKLADPPTLFNINLFKSKSTIRIRNIRQNYSSQVENAEINLHQSKDKLIAHLSSQLNDKISMDYKTKVQLSLHQQTKLQKIGQIQAELANINRLNQSKIKQLEHLETKYLSKIQFFINKEKQEEKILLLQYQKLLEEEEKLKITKSVKKIREQEDWKELEKQQSKLELIARSFQKKHQLLAKEKTQHVDSAKKIKVEKIVIQKNLKVKKNNTDRKSKNVEEMKKMGKQYLEHAKKKQAEQIREKIKLLDVYKKTIDYLPEMKTMMLIKECEDLSKPLNEGQMNNSLKNKKNIRKNVSMLKSQIVGEQQYKKEKEKSEN